MLKNIKLSNYRNLNQVFDLDRFNVMIAPNGSGKSNTLESIYYTHFAHSFHPIANNVDLIGPSDKFARVDLIWERAEVAVTISNGARIERRFEVFGKRKPIKDIVGTKNIVLFAPSTVNIVSGEPSVRRDDLDDHLSILFPEYSRALALYKNTLKNRNQLLRMMSDGREVENELQIFTDRLVELASQIHTSRQQFFTRISEAVRSMAQKLYQLGLNLDIEYVPNVKAVDGYTTQLADKFAENRQKEIVVGKTLYGTHKDDYQFVFNGELLLRYRGSRGQQRIAGLIYKLAQMQLLSGENDNEGILLLDDLMSELDEGHRENVAKFLLEQPHQFILTAAEKLDVPKVLREKANKLNLS